MANGVKWIKIATDIFEDDKMVLIASMDDGALLELIWLKLLTLAGKHSNGGIMKITPSTPYTPKMLSTIFRMDEGIVERALEIFNGFGMIEYRKGAIVITNWNTHQSIESLEAKRARDREYQRKKRKAIKEKNKDDSSNDIATTLDDTRPLEEEKEIEREREVEKEIIVISADAPKTKTTKTFVPPTLKEINEHCELYGICVDTAAFYDYYSAKGWMLGKSTMKDWRAALRSWERNQNKNRKDEKPCKKPTNLPNIPTY